MEKVILGVIGTIALGVMTWGAKTAISDPKTWAALRPFILITFAFAGVFGMGVLIGQVDRTTDAGWALAIGGIAGMFAIGMLNILGEHMEIHRRSQKDD